MRKLKVKIPEAEAPVRGSKWSRWLRPARKGYLLGCCDCNLFHWMEFRVDKDGEVDFRVARAPGYTAQARKEGGIPCAS